MLLPIALVVPIRGEGGVLEASRRVWRVGVWAEGRGEPSASGRRHQWALECHYARWLASLSSFSAMAVDDVYIRVPLQPYAPQHGSSPAVLLAAIVLERFGKSELQYGCCSGSARGPGTAVWAEGCLVRAACYKQYVDASVIGLAASTVSGGEECCIGRRRVGAQCGAAQ